MKNLNICQILRPVVIQVNKISQWFREKVTCIMLQLFKFFIAFHFDSYETYFIVRRYQDSKYILIYA